jgi:hypothetical protein
MGVGFPNATHATSRNRSVAFRAWGRRNVASGSSSLDYVMSICIRVVIAELAGKGRYFSLPDSFPVKGSDRMVERHSANAPR